MDQSRAINTLAPFVALAKSATSPRAAADLITQATSAPNTYVFAELLQQPNIQNLAGNEQYGSFHTLLQCFAWGTWETYKSTPNLPPLSDAQTLKLRLLSLLTIASEKPAPTTSGTLPSRSANLSYPSCCQRLDLASAVDLEHLVTTAVYHDLLTATLNPAAQTVVITSVSPLRDPAPGSVAAVLADLDAWRGRCAAVLADLDAEIRRVHADAERRAKRDAVAEKQIKAAAETAGEKNGASSGVLGPSRGGGNARGAGKREPVDDEDDEDLMDVDGNGTGLGGKRRGGGAGSGGMLSRFGKGGMR